jgi:radical SAM protein with 4Fe4S-binding SPASM domain
MKRKRKNKTLEIIAISLTNRCNLNCTHCGYDYLNRDRNEELPVAFFEKILQEGRDLGARAVNITGGEIFLRSDTLDLIEVAAEIGYFVTLESNGTLITDDDLVRLKALGKKIRIAISLDGIKAETHEKIRGQGTFKKTMLVLEKLGKQNIPARINTVLQLGNIAEVRKITRLAVDKLGMGFRLLPFILEYGKGACSCKTDGVPYENIERLLKRFLYPVMRKCKEIPISIGLNMAVVPLDIDGHLACPWGKSMIGVGPSGIASLCHVSNNNGQFIFGDLKKESLANIWNENKLLNEFRSFNPDNLKGVCGNCLARDVCRGGCRLNAVSSYNDFFAPDSQCQVIYNLGKFPTYALDDVKKNCHY